jgi:hypothetical protein
VLRKITTLVTVLTASALVFGLNTASLAQISGPFASTQPINSQSRVIPGVLAAHGSIRSDDGVSSITYGIVARFTNTSATGQFYVFSYGPNLPAFGVNAGTVTTIKPNADGSDILVQGIVWVGIHPVSVEFHLNRAHAGGAMGVKLSGAINYQTSYFPREWPCYYGMIVYTPPYYY